MEAAAARTFRGEAMLRADLQALIGALMVLSVPAAVLRAAPAHAWAWNYCQVWGYAGQWCGDGQVLARQYDYGSSGDYACVMMMTGSFNIRGGGVQPCGWGSISECLNSATPTSQAFVETPWVSTNIAGYTDNSPNHSGPCY
jgi:hypothetical protein